MHSIESPDTRIYEIWILKIDATQWRKDGEFNKIVGANDDRYSKIQPQTCTVLGGLMT